MRTLTALAGLLLIAARPDPLLTAVDVQTVGGITGVRVVPKDPAIGAGGDFNFVGADNKVILIVMLQDKPVWERWRAQYAAAGEPVTGLGSDAFRSKKGAVPGYVVFLKGNAGVWIQTMGWTKDGKPNFTAAQLEQLAKVAASHMHP